MEVASDDRTGPGACTASGPSSILSKSFAHWRGNFDRKIKDVGLNSYMQIMVRVVATRAQAQMEALRASQRGLNADIAATNRMSPLGQRHLQSLMRFGNQLQWTGRMIQYNFTLPLAIAAGAAAKWQLENEKAMTHVAKVYGDTTAAAEQFNKEAGKSADAAYGHAKAERVRTAELEALGDAFEAISNHYGVQQKEVLEVAGAWAAAGASGSDLAESVNLTMQAMILGELEAAKATDALIAIQAQYNLSAQELTETLATLNSVENQTGISMGGLIEGFSRAAGQAREAGVPIAELAAQLAALVPATGSAANAGNALKTIYSRLMAPTKEAVQVMNAMGLETTAMGWQSATAAERLKLMATEFNNLDASQKNVASSVIASRWQINKFSVLMKELTNDAGYYVKGIDAASDASRNFTRMQEELNEVLSSDPRRLQRMWVMLQNASADIIQPLIPYIIYLAQEVAQLARAFANLDPTLQKTIIFAAVFLALVGPLVRYIGALVTLTHVLAIPIAVLGAAFASLGAGVASVGGVFLKLGTYFGSFLGLISTGLRMLLTLVGGGVLKAGALILANTATIGAALTTLWSRIFLTMALIQTGAIGAMVKSWIAGLILMSRGFSTFGRVTIAIQSAMMAASVLFSRQFFIPMLMALANFTTIFVTAWTTFWVWVRYYMVSVQIAMLAAWQGFRLMFLAGWAGFHVGLAAIGAAFQRAWFALQVMLYRGWAAITAAGNAAVITIEKAAGAVRLAISKAFAGAMVAIQVAMWRGIALVHAAGSRGLALIWATMQRNLLAMAVRFGKAIFVAMTGPWGIAIAAIVGILYAFRSQIAQVWNNLVSYISGGGSSIGDVFVKLGNLINNVFGRLPQNVQTAMVAVVNVIRDAALAIYDWFSYINPFARHSPSLVENVEGGMARVARSVAGLPSKVAGPLRAAYAEIKRFGELTASLSINATVEQRKDDRKTIRKAGGSGAALASYDRLAKMLDRLTPQLGKVEERMNRQQAVVDRWQKKLDQANKRLEKQQDVLDKLQGRLDKYQGKLDEANDRLAYFASAPLKGMQEMEDQIFANQMAQTRLRMEMMNFEDVHGTYDELTKKIEQAAGAQELLRGTQADLRTAGAGSEILGVYDQELGKLDKQVDKYEESRNALASMQAALDKLQREAEKLDLVKALKFDEMLYEIEKAANATKELSFEEIMAGIQGAQSDIDKYTDKVNEATAAVEDQQAVIDRLSEIRDVIQDKLDAENVILDQITTQYNAINDAVGAISSAMSNVVSDAQSLSAALDEAAKKKKGLEEGGYVSPGLQNFLDAKGGDFPDPGGTGIPPRKDWSSQVADIEAFTADLEKDTAQLFEKINPFGTIKEKALAAWDWVKEKARSVAGEIGNFFASMFDGVSLGGGDKFSKVFDGLKTAGEFVTEVIRDILKVVKWAYDLLAPDIKKIGKEIWKGLVKIWDEVGPELVKFKNLIKPIGTLIAGLWTAAKPVLASLVGALLFFAKIALSTFAEVIGPAFDILVGVIKGAVKIIRGVFEVLIGLFTGDWKLAWDGVVSIFSGAWDMIWGILKGSVGIMFGIVEGIVKGVVGFFEWLYDVLVGHSIVPDLVNKIIEVFGWLGDLASWVWDNVLKPVYDFFVEAADKIVSFLKTWWNLFTGVLKALWALGKWFWENILQPVFNFVKALWNDYVKPALSTWWQGVKTVWNVLKTLGTWFWENVLKPVFNKVKELWNEHVRPALNTWWDGIKTVWNVLKTLGTWVWENVLKPVFNFVKSLWSEHVRPSLAGWWEGIKNVWSNLKGLGGWVKTNVMDPVVDKIKAGWNAVKDWMNNNKDMLTKPAKSIVGVVVDAVNFLIKGLNKIADVLPGFSWHIDPIEMAEGGKVPLLAAGGNPMNRRVGGGFKTNGARAIVGEGKANYPEYVIPTDPTYRNRAQGLLEAAASKLGMAAMSVNPRNAGGDSGKDAARLIASGYANYGLPQYSVGGVIGDAIGGAIGAIGDIGGDVYDYLKDHLKDAVSFIFRPFYNTAVDMMDVDWDFAAGMGKSAAKSLLGWALVADKQYGSEIEEPMATGGPAVKRALDFARAQSGKPYIWGGVGPEGYDCSGFMSALTNVLRGQNPYSRLGATGSFPWGGFAAGVGPFTIGSSPNYAGTGIGHMAGTLGGVNVESAGGVGVRIGSSARGYNDGGFSQVYHLQGLAKGGIAKARRGGHWVNIAEAGQDEAIIPLPSGWKQSGNTFSVPNEGGGGNTYIEISGDLSFPNITDPNDVEAFIENLKSLAGGAV